MIPQLLDVSRAHTVSASFTRPEDTVPYAIGDVVGRAITLPLTLGSCIIQTATLISSQNAATKLDGRLWLFDTTVTADNDNAEFTPTDAEMRTLLQVIRFSPEIWIGARATLSLWLPINTTADSRAIFAVLEARNPYAPASAERLDLFLDLVY